MEQMLGARGPNASFRIFIREVHCTVGSCQLTEECRVIMHNAYKSIMSQFTEIQIFDLLE